MDQQAQSLIDALPPTPTPSTSSLAISQIQVPPPTAREAHQLPDLIYSIAFSVLWLFGFARNLISYVVSLGIIPFKTASRIFGIKHTQPQPAAVLLATRRKDREERTNSNHGTRYTSIQHVSQQASGDKRAVNGDRKQWLLQESTKPGSATSSSSTVGSSIRTSSVPNSPRHTPRSSYSLPPIDPSTDTEGVKSRPRYRHSASSRRLESQGELTDEDQLVEADISRGRRRIDHSNRRILFVDSKPARRQTAPPVSLNSSSPNEVPAWTSAHLDIADSPLQTLVPLVDVESSEQRPQSQAKSSPPHSRPVSTNEFGEFVSAPPPAAAAVADVDKGAISGAESSSEKKGKGKEKEKRRSAFKIFGRKRADSVTSSSMPPLSVDTTPSPPAASLPAVSASTSKLRRRSPYPAKAGPATPNSRSVGIMAGSVSVSDAEMSSSCPTSSNTSWLRSRPKKFTRRGRSNSLCSTTGSTTAPTVNLPVKEPVSILRGSLDTLYYDSNIATPPSTSSLSPIAPSPTSQAQIPSPTTPLGRSNTTNATPSRPRFNPFRDLEAHLYNRHGVGTGPGTSVQYSITPVPKEGIRRTRPYEMLGLERPASSSGSKTPNGVKTSRDRRERTEVEQREEEDIRKRNATRRVSAPSVSPTKAEGSGRPVTPSRAQTQPL